ncbi:MAG: ComEC/Rec2 family competence protein [Patescibacteria group bacterium]
MAENEKIFVPADYFFWFLIGIISNVFLLSFFSIKIWQILLGAVVLIIFLLLVRPQFSWLAVSFLAGFILALLRIIFVPEINFSLISADSRSYLVNLRGQLSLALGRIFPEPAAGFSQGIITGSQGVKFEPDFWQALKITSTAHLIAVSGYNITIVARFITRLLSWLTVHRKLIWLFALAGIFVFTVFVGAPISAVRAGIMAALVVIAERFSRQQNTKIAFAFVLGLMVLIDPLSLRYDLSFQLSFLAAFGIFYLAPVWFKQKHGEEKNWILELKKIAAETLSAQAMVLPILIYNFGSLSLTGMLANFLVLPLIPLAMSLSFLSGLGFLVYPALGQTIGFLSFPLLSLIIEIIRGFARFPLAGISGIFIAPLLIIIYYGFIGLIIKKSP